MSQSRLTEAGLPLTPIFLILFALLISRNKFYSIYLTLTPFFDKIYVNLSYLKNVIKKKKKNGSHGSLAEFQMTIHTDIR